MYISVLSIHFLVLIAAFIKDAVTEIQEQRQILSIIFHVN